MDKKKYIGLTFGFTEFKVTDIAIMSGTGGGGGHDISLPWIEL